MGIRSLKTFILTNCPDVTHIAPLENLRGVRLAIDAPCIIHKLWSHWMRMPTKRSTWRDFLRERLSIIFAKLRSVGCLPIIVNEGETPKYKQWTVSRRRAYRDSVRRRAMEMMGAPASSSDASAPHHAADDGAGEWTHVAPRRRRIKGMKLFNSCARPSMSDYETVNKTAFDHGITVSMGLGEAETVCASLVYHDLADVVMSNDTDALAYLGGKRVVLEFSPNLENYRYVDRLELIRHVGSKCERDFIKALVYCGTDYNQPLHPGINPIKATAILYGDEDGPVSSLYEEVFKVYTFEAPTSYTRQDLLASLSTE